MSTAVLNPAEAPIRPHKGKQEMFLSSKADLAIYGGAAGGGKALAIDTLVPTPNGWSTMGQLQAGDVIYDETGSECQVVDAFPIMDGRPCYAVEFSDGSEVVADADHLWVTMTTAEREQAARLTEEFRMARRIGRKSRGSGKRPDLAARNSSTNYTLKRAPIGKVRTTKQIADSVRLAGRGNRVNHSVRACQPVDGTVTDLLIEPYVLGAWLGDGSRHNSVITSADQEIVEAVRNRGYEVRHVPSTKYGWAVLGLITKLKEVGIFRAAKWIPPAYLRASFEQRLELLRGLMDTDGYVDTRGQCEITLTAEALVMGVHELLCSLGIVSTIRRSHAKLNGRIIGPRWRIKFCTEWSAFHLSRKKARQKTTSFRKTYNQRYIVAVRHVASVPVRCIAVDSPSHCYLVGKAFIPTHNSMALILQPLRHISNPHFGAVIFRKSYPQIFGEGGLWDTAAKFYPKAGGKPRESDSEWRFPSGATVKFSYLAHEKDKYDWDGTQVPLIEFDELIHFSESQWWYLLTRNRSTCGVRPYMRASCNPDADSWVADLISWWIDQDSGYPIEERAGVLRWFARVNEKLEWFDSKRQAHWSLINDFGYEAEIAGEMIKSLTFVPAKLEDNPALMHGDRAYRANLLAQPILERERLLQGNWKIRPAAGLKFPRTKWSYQDAAPEGMQVLCRFWDKAATEGGTGARTAGVLIGRKDMRFYVLSVVRGRWGDLEREEVIRATAIADQARYGHVTIGMEQEPGSGGKDSAFATIRNLAGFDVFAEKATGEKGDRWTPFAAQQQAGNVTIVRSEDWDWSDYVRGLDALSGDKELDKGKLKDEADASAGAFKYVADAGDVSSILASGDDDGYGTEMSKDDIVQLPDNLREIIQGIRGGYDRDD
jgi:predicted phage terminase large subunit-like protein